MWLKGFFYIHPDPDVVSDLCDILSSVKQKGVLKEKQVYLLSLFWFLF